MTKQYAPTFTMAQCKKLIDDCMACNDLNGCADVLDTAAEALYAVRVEKAEYTEKTGGLVGMDWVTYMRKLASSFRSGKMAFKVFAKGNSKLPFYNYSELPGYTCPGAGACLEFCYSYTAWRYPAAFMRQLQNTLLMRHKKSIIAQAFAKLPIGTTVRLYVDGDISTMTVLGFWMGQLHRRSDINCYGYSKSWELFREYQLQGLSWPANYCLNISGGSKYDDDAAFKEEMLKLDVTRGEFIAVALNGKHPKGFARYDDKGYHNEVRTVARVVANTPKVFSCTGKCGNCLPDGRPACGVRTFNVVIANGVH